MHIHELHYSNTNTYLIEGTSGRLLFDTGWAGTFPLFCNAMGEIGAGVQDIDYILISHFHPDHMGIAQQIADQGAVLLVADIQREYLHASDAVFAKEKNSAFPKKSRKGADSLRILFLLFLRSQCYLQNFFCRRNRNDP